MTAIAYDEFPAAYEKAMEACLHQISGDDLDVSCACGWYNHDPDPSVDKSATAHILRQVARYRVLADQYEAAYRKRFR